MKEVIEGVDAAALARFDEVIDVRSPAEFALDHLPGAINLPVLSNAERAEVGILYVQVSRLKARRIGAARVARNIAAHLEGPLRERSGSYAPLIYCWRGGQRSLAMATVLEQVGWRPATLAGGYRTWRRAVTRRLYEGPPVPRLVRLDGYTGTAKTEILGRLAAFGVQALDLEALAAHRGSLFGALPNRPQPSQKLFESRLAIALDALDPARPVIVEAESSRIGQIVLPPVLWSAMSAAPAIVLRAPREARAIYLLTTYSDLAADPQVLVSAIDALPPRLGKARLAAWRAMAQAGDLAALASDLMEWHYDPAYELARRRDDNEVLGVIEMDGVGPGDREAAAAHLAARLSGASLER